MPGLVYRWMVGTLSYSLSLSHTHTHTLSLSLSLALVYKCVVEVDAVAGLRIDMRFVYSRSGWNGYSL